MKYLITESQFDKIIFKYLDNQDFVVVSKYGSLFFLNSEDDERAQIRYNKYDGLCYIHYKLTDEISSFFSMKESDSKQVIRRWVERVLGVEVKKIGIPGAVSTNSLYL